MLAGLLHSRWYALACITLLSWVCAGDDSATPMLTLHFNPRVPYEYRVNDTVVGLSADPVAKALSAAGIGYRWEETPINRQFALLKRDSGPDCLVGRFKNAERERFARFSRAYYRDLPQVLLVRADDAPRLQQVHSLGEAIALPDLRILVKEGYSYGSTFDALLSKRTIGVIRVIDENEQMLRMLVKKMADVLIIAPEEAHALIAAKGLREEDFALIRYADSPDGELRYLMCSMSVPVSLIERINTFLGEDVR